MTQGQAIDRYRANETKNSYFGDIFVKCFNHVYEKKASDDQTAIINNMLAEAKKNYKQDRNRFLFIIKDLYGYLFTLTDNQEYKQGIAKLRHSLKIEYGL